MSGVYFYDKDSTEKTFQNLHEALTHAEKIVNDNVENLTTQLNILPIQKLDSMLIHGVSGDIYKDSSWLSTEYFRFIISKEAYEYIKDKYVKDIFKERTWGSGFYIDLKIDDNAICVVKEIFEILKQHDKTIYDQNESKIRQNNQTKEGLFSLLKRIGIKDQYYDYKSKRSNKKDWINYNWYHEISNQIQISQQSFDRAYQEKLSNLQNIINRKLDKIKEEERSKKAEEEKKIKERELAVFIGKYNLDILSTWKDVLNAIIEKNKYLRLGHYLEENRNDWNDGCWYAECGINGFNIESNVDQEIYDDIMSYIEDWQGDGRVFRDCTYNYSVLYQMVEDKQLMRDYSVVYEKLNDF